MRGQMRCAGGEGRAEGGGRGRTRTCEMADALGLTSATVDSDARLASRRELRDARGTLARSYEGKLSVRHV